MSAHIGLPALDFSAAFPQATPASVFPLLASDYYQFDDLLNSEKKALRKRVREVTEKEVAPIMAEAWISLRARETVSIGRELMDGNGTLSDFLVAKVQAFCDLEPIYTYEGTCEINSLVTAREITGIASFKPAVLSKASRF